MVIPDAIHIHTPVPTTAGNLALLELRHLSAFGCTVTDSAGNSWVLIRNGKKRPTLFRDPPKRGIRYSLYSAGLAGGHLLISANEAIGVVFKEYALTQEAAKALDI
jgi:hypothetical protein